MGKYVFGVDVGGTTVKLGLFNAEGELFDKWEIPTRTQEGGSHILPNVAESIREKIREKQIAQEDITGVGVGAPGPIDDDGVVHRAVNLGWETFSIKKTLEEELHVPVRAGNDANVAALGEMWKGGGKGSSDMIMVTLGTGVGGGIITGGKVLTGYAGAGEKSVISTWTIRKQNAVDAAIRDVLSSTLRQQESQGLPTENWKKAVGTVSSGAVR